jgi:hypothetical protein
LNREGREEREEFPIRLSATKNTKLLHPAGSLPRAYGRLEMLFAGRNFVFFVAKWFVGWMQSFHRGIIPKRGDSHGLFSRIKNGLREQNADAFIRS